MSNIVSLLNNKSRKSFVNKLGEGTHDVRIINIVETDDQHRFFDGDADEIKEWKDPCPQIGTVFGNKDGVFTHRFTCKGYKRFDELSAKDQKLCDAAGDEGYAVLKKTSCRIEDAERTDKCFRFLDDMCARTGLPEGSEYAALTGKDITIVIAPNDKGNLRVTKTKKTVLNSVEKTVSELD